MYVAPRPRLETDPLFPLRLAVAAALGFLMSILQGSFMPMLGPSLIVGMMAGMRDAFDPRRGVGGPIGMAIGALVFGWLFGALGAMPWVLVAVTWGVCVMAFYMILTMGNGAGMLIAILTLMMGGMRMTGIQAMNYLQSGIIEASLNALWIMPLCYLLLPTKSRVPLEEINVPAPEGHHGKRALVRGTVLTLVALSLFWVFGGRNIMIAVAATFVLCFSSQGDVLSEARQRTQAVLWGAAWTIVTLLIAQLTAHFGIMIMMILIAGTWFGNQMMFGKRPPMVYQFGFSVFISLTLSILSPAAPFETIVVRIASVVGGAYVAAFLVTHLENIVLGRRINDRLPEGSSL